MMIKKNMQIGRDIDDKKKEEYTRIATDAISSEMGKKMPQLMHGAYYLFHENYEHQ